MSRNEEDTAIIGRCIGECTPSYVSFVSKRMPKMGDYVIIEFDNKEVLGLITGLVRGNPSIGEDIYDPETVTKIKYFEGEEFYIHGVVKILGDVETLEIPKAPPPPGTIIKRASTEILQQIFKPRGGVSIKIGRLISNPDVTVEVDVNKMISRHLAILAVTGAGKSNTVAVIIDELLKIGGCILVFDMHSEYVSSKFLNGPINVIPTNLNPRYLSFSELLILLNIPPKAFIQERYLRKAFKEVKDEIKKEGAKKAFLDLLIDKLREYSKDDDYKKDRKSIIGVLNKVEDMKKKYETILSIDVGQLVHKIELGKANVIDLGSVDEDMADVLVSHILRNLLNERKKFKRTGQGFPYPVFAIMEEAHVLAPVDRNPLSKYWISRIAREGRKFGVGLCLVSQRPKIIDPNALSQANNMIILKLVEPGDQRHVQQASETLSDDLMAQLTSLNVGEAIVVGMMTRVPALVKITKFKGSIIGQDIDIVGEWKRTNKQRKQDLERQKKEIKDIYESGDW